MWKKALNWIIGILFLASLILSGILLYKLCHLSAPQVIEIHDTTVIKKDSLIEKLKYVTKFDTIIDVQYIDTTKHDTVTIKDTIQIPIEHKVDSFTLKKDSLTVTEKIHHSGFHSEIDSVEFTYDWKYTLPEPKKKKFGFVWYIGIGPSGGVNFNIKDRTFDYGPSFGIQGGIGIGGYIK